MAAAGLASCHAQRGQPCLRLCGGCERGWPCGFDLRKRDASTLSVLLNVPAYNGTFSGNGSGLTSLNAANLTGSVPASSLTSVPAGSLTGVIPQSVLPSFQSSDNYATVSGGSGNSASAVLCDGGWRLWQLGQRLLCDGGWRFCQLGQHQLCGGGWRPRQHGQRRLCDAGVAALATRPAPSVRRWAAARATQPAGNTVLPPDNVRRRCIRAHLSGRIRTQPSPPRPTTR